MGCWIDLVMVQNIDMCAKTGLISVNVHMVIEEEGDYWRGN